MNYFVRLFGSTMTRSVGLLHPYLLSNNIFSFCGAFRHSGGAGEKFFCISQTDLESLSSVYDVYVVLFLSVVKVDLLLQFTRFAEKEKGPRSEVSRRDLSVCLCIC